MTRPTFFLRGHLHPSGQRSKPRTNRVARVTVGVSAVMACALLATALALALENRRRINESSEDSAEVRVTASATPPAGFAFATALYRGAGEWAEKASMPEALSDVAAVACQGKVYLLGGHRSGGSVSARVLVFDPFFETYENVTSLPEPRYRHGAACVNATDGSFNLYVVGGYNSTSNGDSGVPTASTYRYNSLTRVWTPAGDLHIARGDPAVAAVGATVFVAGGYGQDYDMTHSGTSLEVLDTAAASPAWATGPAMATSRGDARAAVVGTILYAIGGWGGHGAFIAAVERFDTARGEWATVAPLTRARGDAAVATLQGGRVVVAGGETGTLRPCDAAPEQQCSDATQVPLHSVELYDPQTNTWTDLAPLPTARFRFDAAASDGVLFVFGGHRTANVELSSVDALYLIDHPSLFVHVKV